MFSLFRSRLLGRQRRYGGTKRGKKIFHCIRKLIHFFGQEEYDNQILFVKKKNIKYRLIMINYLLVQQKESVFGLFIRKAHSEFLTLPANRLHDLFMAFSEYCSNCPKDTFLFDSTSRQGRCLFFFDNHAHLCSLLKGWISEHNISEFLRSQAEMIESG